MREHEKDCMAKLSEYERLEKEGRLVILPCKPGTALYKVNDDCNYWGCCCGSEDKCRSCEYRDLHVSRVILQTDHDVLLHKNDFGEVYFLTKEEAEIKIKEMQG